MNGKETIRLSISTHPGIVRDHNEDNFSVNGKICPDGQEAITINGNIGREPMLLGVYDGMGGEKNGEKASQIAAELSRSLFENMNASEADGYRDTVNEYISAANSEVCRTLKNNSSTRGGTTAAIVYFKDNAVYPFSLGDSRIYLYYNCDLVQISEDHTLAMRKYKANIYTLEEAEKSIDSHKLTLFIGVDVESKGLTAQWYQPFFVPEGAKLLLCSDGLYDMCTKQEIMNILSAPSENYSDDLVNAAINNGGLDNITCIVADFG